MQITYIPNEMWPVHPRSLLHVSNEYEDAADQLNHWESNGKPWKLEIEEKGNVENGKGNTNNGQNECEGLK